MRMILAWSLLAVAAGVATAAEVDGVFGLSPVPEGAALAVWVPLQAGQAVGGVSWYHNDGESTFPELLAAAGTPDDPGVLVDAVAVGQDLGGASLSWSEWAFETAYASATGGLFLVFRLPADAPFLAEGNGVGLGYRLLDGPGRCWVSPDGEQWHALGGGERMAVEPIVTSDKSKAVVVLGAPTDRPAGRADEATPASPSPLALTAAPNPFNPQTVLHYGVPVTGDVRLTVYDVRGQRVRGLVSGVVTAGEHTVVWDGRDGAGRRQPSGVYLARLTVGDHAVSRRLTLLQ
jgi:hypothetical protein